MVESLHHPYLQKQMAQFDPSATPIVQKAGALFPDEVYQCCVDVHVTSLKIDEEFALLKTFT
jgi:hypothetical protein